MPRQGQVTLRYANCWEDADLLVSRVGELRGKHVLSISSGGENSLSLLCRDPGLLVVVDKNPVQLFVFELKRAAMKALEREEFLAFLGYATSADRWRTYRLLKGDLSPGARAYWDEQRGRLETGFIHTGRVARTLRLLARFVRPLIHGAARSRELMAAKSAGEQAEFFRKNWDNRRWRAMVKILFGKPAIYAISPEPDFFKYHSGSGVPGYLLEKTARHLSSVTAQENHMLHYFLFGHFGALIPHFARQANYATIKANLGATVTHEGMLETAFPRFGRFDAFNLSNIFEYTTPASFATVAEAVVAGAKPQARLAYWNILVPRRLSEARPDAFRNLLDTDLDRSVPDKGWIYYRFVLDQRLDFA
jgi:S-adenosylmethionine-diacylglycerol 3-amino-3-carboxypropyl transferase